MDLKIASICIAHDILLLTRNLADPPPCGLRVDFASLVLRAMSGSLSRRARLASVPNTSDPSAFFNVEGRVGRRRQHEGLGVSWSLSFDLD